MWNPPWKNLVDQLKAQEFESPYLDRLDRRLSLAAGRATLEQEIIEEMAYALTKSADKVNLVLLELDVLRHEIEAAADATVRRDKTVEFNAKRTEAIRARWELMVHRESLGFLRHDGIEQDFPVPERLHVPGESTRRE